MLGEDSRASADLPTPVEEPNWHFATRQSCRRVQRSLCVLPYTSAGGQVSPSLSDLHPTARPRTLLHSTLTQAPGRSSATHLWGAFEHFNSCACASAPSSRLAYSYTAPARPSSSPSLDLKTRLAAPSRTRATKAQLTVARIRPLATSRQPVGLQRQPPSSETSSDLGEAATT